MPQYLHRREFIQASGAAAGVIAAAGLPRASRAASSPTIDVQVHAYERNHPGRPWAGTLVGPEEITGDQMVAAMNAVGVDGAVLVSPFSLYRYDASDQPALFELKEDCRSVSERTAAGRYREPSLFAFIEQDR